MIEVKRYGFTQDIEGNTEPIELEKGEWVRYDDVKNWKSPEQLKELRQQLKDKLTKLSKTQSIYENVTWAEIDDIIDEVLGVEGEK